jgi:ABC-type phosphate/phosphonate transport system substrate-binding protein
LIAFLGMYDLPALRAANDAFWGAIRMSLGRGPERLTRDSDPWDIWQSPDLLFAQTCGLPYRARLHGHVQLVGTPDYALPDCPPGYYRSLLVARRGDSDDLLEFAGRVFAYNEALSQSGWAGPMTHLQAAGISFSRHVRTGAHAESVRAVGQGTADLAGIDALTWALLQEHGDTSALKVIARTPPVPGLPYITSLSEDADAIHAATANAIATLPESTRRVLHLNAIIRLEARDYLEIPTPPPPPTA